MSQGIQMGRKFASDLKGMTEDWFMETVANIFRYGMDPKK